MLPFPSIANGRGLGQYDPRRIVPVDLGPVKFKATYASDGDTNGIFYAFGTNFGQQSWANPSGVSLTFTAYPALHGASGAIGGLSDRANSAIFTNGLAPANYIVDLGVGRRLVVDYLSFKSRSDATTSMTTDFVLAGSNDISDYWNVTPIFQAHFAFSAINQFHSWPVSSVGQAYAGAQAIPWRYISWWFLGNNTNDYFFTVGELELYGTLR